MDNTMKRTCLVLMPFDKKYNEVYENVYRQVCNQHKLDCY